MKKILYVGAITFVSLLLTNGAYATDYSNELNKPIYIADTNGKSGATLTLDQSPNVLTTISTTANAFSLVTVNDVAVHDKRVLYGISSGFSGYYQKPDDDLTDPRGANPTAVAADGSAFTTANKWIPMGSKS